MGSQGIRALGAADGASVRGRRLDCSATHGDARHHVYGGLSMRLVAGWLIFGWVFFWARCAPAGCGGGADRIFEKKGGFPVTAFYPAAPLPAGPVGLTGAVQEAF